MSLTSERIDLNRVAMFLQVAEAQGVNAAAAKAKLPKSSVSRALTQLEAELGVELVVRRTKSFQLTEAGQDFYESASRGIAAVSDARERLRRDTSIPRGKLRVASPPGFASHIIAPVIAWFVKHYPEIEIELCVTAASVLPERDGFDVVLSTGVLEDSSSRVRKIGAAECGIYASPDYLEERGTPKKPDDLAGHDCVLVSRQRKKSTVWSMRGPSGRLDVNVRGRVIVDDIFAAVATTAAGAGLMVMPVHMAQANLALQLVRVLPEWTLGGDSAQILFADSRYTPRRISAFVDAVEHHMRGNCPGQGVMKGSPPPLVTHTPGTSADGRSY